MAVCLQRFGDDGNIPSTDCVCDDFILTRDIHGQKLVAAPRMQVECDAVLAEGALLDD